MDELVTWLRAQLDDDERIATTAQGGLALPWVADRGHILKPTPGCETFVVAVQVQAWNADHIARHDPARVLREVEAKRQILDGIQMCKACGTGRRCVPHDSSAGLPTATRPAHPVDEQLIRLLALSFVDRPGYREEWKP